ncbi:hypothetical protein Tco_1228998 [Tanacetum coccineum]
MTAYHNDWDTSAQRSESSSSITSSSDPEIVAIKAEMAEINKNLMKVLQITPTSNSQSTDKTNIQGKPSKRATRTRENSVEHKRSQGGFKAKPRREVQ